MSEVKIKYEIGTNLRMVIEELIKAYRSNVGSEVGCCPMSAIKGSFHIDFTKVTQAIIKKGITSADVSVNIDIDKKV